MGNLTPVSLRDLSTVLRVSIVLHPDLAARLDVTQLTMPDIALQLQAGTLASIAHAVDLLAGTDVMIVEIDPADPAETEAFERFCARHAGQMAVVAAVRALSVQTTRQILRSDAVDVLPLPFTPDELVQAVDSGRQALARVPATPAIPAFQPPRRRGKVISLLGALGGVGATSLATQLGVIWAATARVCLIDLDVQFGNAALYLNLRPRLTVADLVDAGERMDAEFLASVAETHNSGMAVVGAPIDIVPLDMVTPDAVQRMLALAADTYDVVLVDLPDAWINWSAAALTRSDVVLLVSELSVAGVHQAKRQLEMIDANGLSDRVLLVFNRVATSLFRKVDLTQTEQALKRKVDVVVSNDYAAMSAAIDEGRPVSTIKIKSRIEKDLRMLVATLDALPLVTL
ncbi:pilus assembly protein CpaE [Polymorphobacter multimanifer]|uniref:Pilus assembly protein CpaE n=1 Tax=Polymorphobacter multimanifer TaxID=1070431 RepID=A0A841L1Q6_9SPHN|nr:AAA family ATPase [Polymorphobacter multimanifer]MBB6226597.1 pilus assembly protein CpaE [Polymorphobacter multimanifer]GGI88450.1 pilus assembly protein CpaE [Polymorphobacter multimanifer]